MKRLAAWAYTLVLASCATHPPLPTTPDQIPTGPARMILHAPYRVRVLEPWTMEVMLLGRPSAYPHSAYLLMLSAEGHMDKVSIRPSLQRYYLLTMAPFDPGFYPRDGRIVMWVELHPVRGFDFTGNAVPGPAMLQDVAVVRYTYLREARMLK